jgi:hypothetical protein
MTLEKIINSLNLKILTVEKDFSVITPLHGYVSDMLSCVMIGAGHNSIWVTLQAHSNIVAVARLLDLTAIIITEGANPDKATIEKANEEDVILLSAEENSFHIVGKLWEMGLREK